MVGRGQRREQAWDGRDNNPLGEDESEENLLSGLVAVLLFFGNLADILLQIMGSPYPLALVTVRREPLF